MANTRKYDHIITQLHNEWCRANGYPERPAKPRRKKLPVSGTPNRETGSADNLNAENSERFVNRASSNKPQAPSVKHQATREV
tara:strand:+ start:296 stop:544 length:249 start_codon:yes stop_codon:yes gene_type:complete